MTRRLLLLTALLIGLKLQAQSNIELLHTTQVVMSAPDGVAVYQSHAYAVGAGYSLYIIDLSNPENPQYAGVYNTPGDAQTKDIEIVGSLALLFHQYQISFVNLGDPVQPELLGSLPFSGYYGYHAVFANHVLVSTSSGNVYCFDFSAPSAPVQTDMINCGYAYPTLGVNGTQAWVGGSSDGIMTLDISDPDSLSLGAVVPNTENVMIKATSGNLLFASYYTEARIYEAGPGGSLNLLSTIPVGADYIANIEPGDGFIIVDYDVAAGYESASFFKIYGISDPAQPVYLSGYTYGDNYQARLAYSGGYLFLVPGEELRILTLGTGGSPMQYQGCYRKNRIRWIEANASHAFVGSDSYIDCLSNYLSPQPTTLSSLSLPDLSAMAVSGNLLLSTTTSLDEMGWPNSPPWLRIHDVSNPADPQQVYSEDIPCWYQVCRNISVSGSHAWLAAGYEGIWQCDLSTPSNITVQEVLNTPADSFEHVHAYGNYLFCGMYVGSSNSRALWIYDVSDLGSPVLVSSLPLPGELRTVSVCGNRAYLGGSFNTVLAVDISQIASPGVCASIAMQDPVLRIEARPEYLVLVSEAGLRVVKVASGGALSLAGYYDFPFSSYGYGFLLFNQLALAAQSAYLGVYEIGAAIAACDNDDNLIPPPAPWTLKLYPNPFLAELRIEGRMDKPGKISLDIYNIRGQRVKSLFKGYRNGGDFELGWDGCDESGAEVPSGIYLLKASSNKGSSLSRILKR